MGAKITKAVWVAQAVDLSIKGWSYRRIAKKVGKHHSTVAEALEQEFQRVRPSFDLIQARRAILREQIDRQIAAWLPKSTKGNKDAALVVIRCWERAAKLDGLDAPIETVQLSTDVNVTDVRQELLDRLSRLADAASASEAPSQSQ